jgi:hypothetical protein
MVAAIQMAMKIAPAEAWTRSICLGESFFIRGRR